MKHREPLEDWEKDLHRELDALPELQAPSTLIPAVMDRIAAPTLVAWYRAAWWQWPLAARAASLVLALAVLGGLGWMSGSFVELEIGRQLAQAYAGLKGMFGSMVASGEAFVGSGAIWWDDYGQMIVVAVAALLLSAYLTCVAAGTALYQLAWKRTL